jgi:hypothetical protein
MQLQSEQIVVIVIHSAPQHRSFGRFLARYL